jgi:hypothetical protein
MPEFTKHPAFSDELLPVREDAFKPEFRRDTLGRYFMQLPGYGKWMVSNEPGSKIISQGSENESGNPATNPASIMTGSLHANTVISVGDSIYLDGGTGCIHVGDYLNRVGPSISICGGGIRGYSGPAVTFAYFLETDGGFGPGDVFIGDYTSNEYILWDDSTGELHVKGNFIIQGDIQSANFVHNVSGYKLTYLTGSAEFQDVIVRGKVLMETGSTGSADYIAESAGRKWAAESGADITGGHTSNNTANVAYSTATNTADGAARGLNAINAAYHYKTWLQSSDMQLSGVTTGPAVVMDKNGIYGWNALAQNTFQLNAITGDALFRGTVYASAGMIGGWLVDADRIWNQLYVAPNYTKVELNVREGVGINMHLQAMTDTNSSYTSPTGIQITSGPSTAPDPKLDIYVDGTRRVTLNTTGLRFYLADGTTVSNQVLLGTADGDVTFGGGIVRLFANGIRISYPQPLNVADGVGSYFQVLCKPDIVMGGIAGGLSAPTNNQIRIDNDGGGAIARFNGTPSGSWIANHEYAFAVYGPLSLYTVGYDPGNTLGCIYYNTASNEVRVRINTGWVSLGAGGGGLPSGNDYDMLRCVSGTTWTATADVYWGSSSVYHLYRDPGTGDTYFEIPSTYDYAFKVGSTFRFIIYATGLVWTDGALQCYSQLNFTLGGQVSTNGSRITANLEFAASGSIFSTGDIYAGSTAGSLIAGSSTGYVVCRSRYFLPVTGAFNAAKYYLREA